eukprot:1532702-Amphidinium_carterae.1
MEQPLRLPADGFGSPSTSQPDLESPSGLLVDLCYMPAILTESFDTDFCVASGSHGWSSSSDRLSTSDDLVVSFHHGPLFGENISTDSSYYDVGPYEGTANDNLLCEEHYTGATGANQWDLAQTDKKAIVHSWSNVEQMGVQCVRSSTIIPSGLVRNALYHSEEDSTNLAFVDLWKPVLEYRNWYSRCEDIESVESAKRVRSYALSPSLVEGVHSQKSTFANYMLDLIEDGIPGAHTGRCERETDGVQMTAFDQVVVGDTTESELDGHHCDDNDHTKFENPEEHYGCGGLLSHECLFVFDHWDDTDDLQGAMEQKVRGSASCVLGAWDCVAEVAECVWVDADDLTPPNACPICLEKATTFVRRSTAHICLEPAVHFYMSRHENWKRRARVNISTTRAHVKKWRWMQAAKRATAKAKGKQQSVRSEKGVRASFPQPTFNDWTCSLGIDVRVQQTRDFGNLCPFTSGDGNCAWRALWLATGRERNWKVLKKRIIRAPRVRHLLCDFAPWGVLGNAACFVAAASYLDSPVRIQLSKHVCTFVPCGLGDVEKCNSVDIVIRNGHAQPLHPCSANGIRRDLRGRKAQHASTCVNSRCHVGQLGASSIEHEREYDEILQSCVLAGGKSDVGYDKIVPGQRKRKTRYHVRVDSEPTTVLFVDETATARQASQAIALHLGTDPAKAECERIDGVMKVSCTRTGLTKKQQVRILEMIQEAPTVRTRRAAEGAYDVFLGHRATRKRGVLQATYKIRPTILARAVRALSRATPATKFTSLGVVEHREITAHEDPATKSPTVMYTWGGPSTCLWATSPVTHQAVPLRPTQHLVFFDASLTHAVQASSSCISIVAYSTVRSVAFEHALELRSYAFPVESPCRPEMEVTTNDEESATGNDYTTDETEEHGGKHGAVLRLTGLCTPVEVQSRDTNRESRLASADPACTRETIPVSISPTLPYEEPEQEREMTPWDFVVQQIDDVGVIDNAEHSRLTQKAKDLQLGYQLKLVRALITLDGKLRKALREEPANKTKILGVLKASMARWHMQPNETGQSASSGSGTNGSWEDGQGDQAWKEVKPKKKRNQSRPPAMGEEPQNIKLCPSAWNIPVRSEEDYKLDGSAVYQISSKAKLHAMSLEAIHSEHSVMAVAPFRLDVGFAPP